MLQNFLQTSVLYIWLWVLHHANANVKWLDMFICNLRAWNFVKQLFYSWLKFFQHSFFIFLTVSVNKISRINVEWTLQRKKRRKLIRICLFASHLKYFPFQNFRTIHLLSGYTYISNIFEPFCSLNIHAHIAWKYYPSGCVFMSLLLY